MEIIFQTNSLTSHEHEHAPCPDRPYHEVGAATFGERGEGGADPRAYVRQRVHKQVRITGPEIFTCYWLREIG